MTAAAAAGRAPVTGCPVRGHSHDLALHEVHVQDGTGDIAWTLACPGGRYRFFLVEKVWEQTGARALIRRTRPRWGWGDDEPRRAADVCPGCHVELPLTGSCGTCG